MSTLTSVAAAPAADLSDVHLHAAWQRHCQLRRLYRSTRLELAALRREIAQMIALRHDALARPGLRGEFHAWLRLHRIPRATAYRLLRLYRRPANPSRSIGLNCLTETTPPPVLAHLHGRTLAIGLTWQQAVVARRALTDALYSPALAARIGQAVTDCLTKLASLPARFDITNLWLRPETEFVPKIYGFQPPIRILLHSASL